MEQMKTLNAEMIAKLKEPLPQEAVSPHPTKAYLSTIKVIYVVERLNEVFGIGGWYVENRVVEKKSHPTKNGAVDMVVVESTLTVPECGIRISMFGGNDNEDLGDAYKGACTDALSKIGSYLYIGMDVYKGLYDKKAAQSRPPAKKEERPAPKQEAKTTAAPSSPGTQVIRGVVDPQIKDGEKGTWIKVGTNSVRIWDFKKCVAQGLKAGVEVEIEATPKTTAKGGRYFDLVKVVTIVPNEAVA
jgi:hypothetical protein